MTDDRGSQPGKQLTALLLAASVSTNPAFAADPQSEARSLGDWARWLFGLDVTAAGIMSGGDVGAGAIWVAAVNGDDARLLADDGAYNTPVFAPDGQTLVARRGDEVVVIPLAGDVSRTLATVPGLVAIVAIDNRGRVLAVREGNAGRLLVEIRGGVVHDASLDVGAAGRAAIDALVRPTKTYTDGLRLRVDVSAASRFDLEETFDVFLEHGDKSANVSNCYPQSCGQPALSPDRTLLAFIKV